MARQAQQPSPPPGATPAAPPVVKSFVNEVIVPVVARDSKGQAVGSLTQNDFQVFDDGKPQTLTGFMVVKHLAGVSSASPPAPVPTPGNAAPAPQPVSPALRFVVFVFDDLNLDTSDLMQAQQAAAKAVDTALAPSDIAAVLATSGTNSGLTKDHAKLKTAIMDLRVKNVFRQDSHDCPNVDYYMGDLIVNKHDSMALDVATQDAMTCSQTSIREMAEQMARQAAQRAVAMGDQDSRASLGFLHTVIGKMGTLPGQRVMILVSSGFLTPTPEAMTLKSDVLDTAARANVVINVLDARGLYTTGLDASQSGGGSPRSVGLRTQYRQASMLENADVMEELADGTGGTFFHNNNDLAAGLGGLITGPEYLYLLAFSTANLKANGAYHKLKVKVNQPGLKLQARRGYFAPQPEKKPKN